MTIFFAMLAGLHWLLAALLALKADAMLGQKATEYTALNLVLALLFWPIIAYGLITTKHICFTTTTNPNYRY